MKIISVLKTMNSFSHSSRVNFVGQAFQSNFDSRLSYIVAFFERDFSGCQDVFLHAGFSCALRVLYVLVRFL